MKYDIATGKLHVAICDFGIGIAKSIRGYFTDIKTDGEALIEATKDKVTVKSQKHNGGHGLNNVISHLGIGDTLRILSNQALLVCKDGALKTFYFDFCFTGTLIYYDISF